MSAAFDEQERRFYIALGHAVGQWTYVEDALFQLFARALRAKTDDLAAAVFYSQINLRAKLDMIDAVLSVTAAEPYLAEWKSLRRRVQKHSGKRNSLVHGHVVHVAMPPKPGTTLSDLETRLKPNVNNPSDRWAYVSGIDDITAQQIKQITNGFGRLYLDLVHFHSSLKL